MNPKSEASIVAAAHACRGLNAVITAATTSSHEFDEYPNWMRFTLDDAMIDEVLKLRAICASYGLSDASVYRCCEVGRIDGDNEPCRTDLDAMRVYAGSFFVLEANVRDCDSHFETVPFFFDGFFANVLAGRRFFTKANDEKLDAIFKADVEEEEAEVAAVTDDDKASES